MRMRLSNFKVTNSNEDKLRSNLDTVTPPVIRGDKLRPSLDTVTPPSPTLVPLIPFGYSNTTKERLRLY